MPTLGWSAPTAGNVIVTLENVTAGRLLKDWLVKEIVASMQVAPLLDIELHMS